MLSLPTDADGDPVSTIGTWTVDGVPASGSPGPADIHEGEVWTCTVTTNDGEDDGGSATASVTIGALPLLQSCLEILEAGYSTGDGEYEIDPPCGDTITVWCDMSTDGGGWQHAWSRSPAKVGEPGDSTRTDPRGTSRLEGNYYQESHPPSPHAPGLSTCRLPATTSPPMAGP